MGTTRRAAYGTALFFVVAPFVVAGVVPWAVTQYDRGPGTGGLRTVALVLGVLLVAAGLPVLVSAFVRFAVEGRGTPAPIAPTEQLVVGGLYRWVRNPMYLAVLSIIVGQAGILWQPGLLVYAAIVAVAVVGFVLGYEQPELARTYGSAYDDYRAAVPGWWPARHPYPRREPARGSGSPAP